MLFPPKHANICLVIIETYFPMHFPSLPYYFFWVKQKSKDKTKQTGTSQIINVEDEIDSDQFPRFEKL